MIAALKLPVLQAFMAWSRSRSRPPAPPLDPRLIRRIAVFQFGGIGDTLRLLPLLGPLARAYPDAELFTLTDQSSTLFDLLPPGAPACRHLRFDFTRGPLDQWRQIRALRRERFDLLILPILGDGFVEIAVLARCLGGRYRVGFDLNGGGALFTHTLPFRVDESIGLQYGRLMKLAGAGDASSRVPPHLAEADRRSAREKSRALGLGERPYVVVHPWASNENPFRSWPADHMRELLATLPSALGVAVAIIGGPSERERARSCFGGLPGVVDCTGALTFSETCALIAESRCLVGNDSCFMHVGDALRIPVVAIFGSTPPEQVLLPGNTARVVLADRPLPCRPCYRHQALFPHRCGHAFACLESIPAEQVLTAVRAALADPVAAAPAGGAA